MTLKQCIGYGVASIDVVRVTQDDINRSAMYNRRSRSSQPYLLPSSFHFASRNSCNSPACSRVAPRRFAGVASNTLTSMPIRVRHCALFDTERGQVRYRKAEAFKAPLRRDFSSTERVNATEWPLTTFLTYAGRVAERKSVTHWKIRKKF